MLLFQHQKPSTDHHKSHKHSLPLPCAPWCLKHAEFARYSLLCSFKNAFKIFQPCSVWTASEPRPKRHLAARFLTSSSPHFALRVRFRLPRNGIVECRLCLAKIPSWLFPSNSVPVPFSIMGSQKPDIQSSPSTKTIPKPYGNVVLTLKNCLLPEEKLSPTPSQLDGLDRETETDLRILGCELIQTAGILLKLPQVIYFQSCLWSLVLRNQCGWSTMASIRNPNVTFNFYSSFPKSTICAIHPSLTIYW